eukprot:ANDGO_06809.mRNA.1 F-box/LRR-repeat protein 15
MSTIPSREHEISDGRKRRWAEALRDSPSPDANLGTVELPTLSVAESLPLEVLFRVYGFMESHESLRLGTVSRTWLFASKVHSKTLDFRSLPHKVISEGLRSALSSCSGVESLDLSNFFDVSDEFVSVLLKGMPSVIELSLSFCSLLRHPNFTSCQLRRLSLRSCSRITTDVVQEFHRILPNLEYLDLTGCVSITSFCLTHPKLQFLSLAECSNLLSVSIDRTLTSTNPVLEHLDLSDTFQLSLDHNYLSALLSLSASLRVLLLSNSDILMTLAEILDAFPFLSELRIVAGVRSLHLSELSTVRPQCLQDLRLFNCRLDPAALSLLVSRCPALRRLDVSRCNLESLTIESESLAHVTFDSNPITSLSIKCPCVKELRFVNLDKFTDAALFAFWTKSEFESLERLQFLNCPLLNSPEISVAVFKLEFSLCAHLLLPKVNVSSISDLVIRGCPAFPTDFVSDFVRSCDSLISLFFSSARLMETFAISSNTLRHVVFSHTEYLNELKIAHVLRFCPRIESLCLNHCPTFVDLKLDVPSSLCYLEFFGCSSLQSLTLSLAFPRRPFSLNTSICSKLGKILLRETRSGGKLTTISAPDGVDTRVGRGVTALQGIARNASLPVPCLHLISSATERSWSDQIYLLEVLNVFECGLPLESILVANPHVAKHAFNCPFTLSNG